MKGAHFHVVKCVEKIPYVYLEGIYKVISMFFSICGGQVL
jgi:hypothetical protein